MTTNTEPLKVGECKATCTTPGTCERYGCATEPSPAEVGGDGLPESEDIEALIECYATYYSEEWCGTTSELAIHEDERREEAKQILRDYALSQQSPATTPELIRYGKGHPASCICSLCKQSPARAEGELLEALRFQVESGESYEVKRRHAIAAIERALNQRLAVKEGEIDTLLGDYVEAVCSGGEVGEAYDKLLSFINSRKLSSRPVSDDQQAKDAARYRWLRDVHEGKSITMHTPIGHRMEITVNCGSGALVFKPSENLDFQRTLDAAIDAAIDATKQEEV